MASGEEWLSVARVAEMLGLKPVTVRALIESGELAGDFVPPYPWPGARRRAIRIRPAAVDEFIERALLATAVGAEFGLSDADECLMGAAEIIQLAACGRAADPYRARDAALKHAHQHREEYGEPLLLRDLSDFYRRSQDQPAVR